MQHRVKVAPAEGMLQRHGSWSQEACKGRLSNPTSVADVTCTAIPAAAGLVKTRRCSSASCTSTGAAELLTGSGLMTSTVLTCVAGKCAPGHGCLSGLSGASRRLMPGVLRGVLRAKPTVLPQAAIVVGCLTPPLCRTSGLGYLVLVCLTTSCTWAAAKLNMVNGIYSQVGYTLPRTTFSKPAALSLPMNVPAPLSRTSNSSTMQLSNRPSMCSRSAHIGGRPLSSVHSRQAGQQYFRTQKPFGRRLGSFRSRANPAPSALFGHTVAENSFVVNGDIEKVDLGVAHCLHLMHFSSVLHLFGAHAAFCHPPAGI